MLIAIRFCFMPLLRSELYRVAELWNQHKISSSKFGNSSGPTGRPDCMLFLAHLYNTDDFKVSVDKDDVLDFIIHARCACLIIVRSSKNNNNNNNIFISYIKYTNITPPANSRANQGRWCQEP